MNEQLICRIRALAAGEAQALDDDLCAALEELGLEYEAREGDAVLRDPPELLDAEHIRGCLRDGAPLLERLDVHFTIDSTNTWQLERAAERDFHGSACLAERQEAGKGRRGRRWVSPFGRNIYMSVGWQVPRTQSVSGLSLAVGMVVVGVLRDAGLEGAGLKWPNDVLLGEGKLAGILLEMAAPTAQSHRVVIGCGVNLRLDARDAALVDQSFSTVLDHIDVSRNGLVVKLLDAMLPALAAFSERGFAPFAGAWPDYDRFAGERVSVLLGERWIHGINAGIDQMGNLLLDTDQGRRSFNAGEVSLRQVAEGL